MTTLAVRLLALLALGPVPLAQAQAVPEDAVLDGMRLYLQGFQPEAGETSLLAYAKREALDWTAVQNLFSLKVTDPPHHFLDWRGHSPLVPADTFTTVRVGAFLKGSRALLVINREWCAQATCQSRTAFAWLGGGKLRPVPEASVIPAIQDADFYARAAPPCLKGVSLGVTYLPARLTPTVSALAVVPPKAAQACQQSGTPLETATRPLRLNWDAAAGKFRKGW